MAPTFLILEVALDDRVATVVGATAVGVLAHARFGPRHYYRTHGVETRPKSKWR
jgi:hypothetical protein